MRRTEQPYLPAAVWTYGDAAALFFGGLVGALIAIALAVAANGSDDLADVTLLVISSSGQAAVVVGMLLYMSRSRGAGSWDLDFGLRFEPSDWTGVVKGIVLQIAVIFLILVPLAMVFGIDDPPQQDVANIAGSAAGLVERIAVLAILVVVAPVTEEILFRGVLLSRLRRSMDPAWAIGTSAALFAGTHLIDPDAIFVVPGLFVIGLVLGYQSLRTGRIGLAIVTHGGVNLLAAIALLLDIDV